MRYFWILFYKKVLSGTIFRFAKDFEFLLTEIWFQVKHLQSLKALWNFCWACVKWFFSQKSTIILNLTLLTFKIVPNSVFIIHLFLKILYSFINKFEDSAVIPHFSEMIYWKYSKTILFCKSLKLQVFLNASVVQWGLKICFEFCFKNKKSAL